MANTEKGTENKNLNSFEKFIFNNQKILSYIGIGILVVILGYIGYQRLILEPREEQAKIDIIQAQLYFENDSLNYVLDGDSLNYGTLDIIDEYGMTNTANLAHYYAGISFLRKGKYQEAIDHLKEFDTESKIIGPIATGAIGDAYSQLKKYDKAAEQYLKAADLNSNSFTTPKFLMKAGLVLIETGDYSRARETYQKIIDDFPETTEAGNAKKFLGKVESMMAKKS